ncbi:hypothetical protein ACWGK5_30610 [Rhodococcus qingshengii]
MRVRSSVRPQLLDILHSNEVDLSLLWSYTSTEEAERSLSLQPLMEDEIVLTIDDQRGAEDTSLSNLHDSRWTLRSTDHLAAEVLYRSCRAGGSNRMSCTNKPVFTSPITPILASSTSPRPLPVHPGDVRHF